MTWNIRHGRGTDGAVDLERIADVVLESQADVVLLQEVDRGCVRTGGVDQTQRLAELTGLESAFVRHRPYDGGDYGVALLTRLPLRATRRLDLPDAPAPLAALVAELDWRGRSLHVASVHFVRTTEQRASQAAAARAHLDALGTPYVVGGDFNGERGDPALLPFAGVARAEPTGDPRTFPADAPAKEIDFVFASGPAIDGARVIDEALASDHRPVLVELDPR